MKTLIISILAFAGLSLLAPTAEAGYYERYVKYYDRCGRPVYGQVYRDDYRRSYSHRGSYNHRRTYYSPGSSYRSYSRRTQYCAPRGRFSIRFGF